MKFVLVFLVFLLSLNPVVNAKNPQLKKTVLQQGTATEYRDATSDLQQNYLYRNVGLYFTKPLEFQQKTPPENHQKFREYGRIIEIKVTKKSIKGKWIESNQSNCKIWNPFSQPNVSVTWEGKCQTGYASGKGTIIWYSNSNYVGVHYAGEVRKGKHDGYGKLVFRNVWTYQGQWFEGFQHGRGKTSYANGDSYDGDWVDGEANGSGVFIWAFTKQKYVGDWVGDLPNGYGILYRGGIEYKGKWKDGCLGKRAFIPHRKSKCGL